METQSSGVIRVPLADPSKKKEGLLCFSLPRECVRSAEVPDFYGVRDTFKSSRPYAGSALDKALRDLAVARGHLSDPTKRGTKPAGPAAISILSWQAPKK